MLNLPLPDFIERDAAVIIAESIADYEARTGRVLEPAQVETLMLQTFAYRELLLRNQVQDAAMQNLLAFARFPMLDYLGDFLGVQRLPSQSARTTILFNLTPGHGDIVIPQGTRIQTTDGRAVFELIQDTPVLTGTDTATVTAISQQAGAPGNDYALGTISVILDPQPYLATAENISVSEGGSDEESDEQLRERIRLAPNRFSSAGPYKAYEFYAASASPLIIDVTIDNRHYQDGDVIPAGKSIGDVIPGTVEVFPLMADLAETPSEILDAVLAVLNADKVRPLNDIVFATSPTAVNTTIVVDLTLYEEAIQSDIVPVVQANLEAFRDGRRKLLGQDIVIDQIKAVCMIPGVYACAVASPATDLVIESTEFANITDITVNVVGTNVG